MPGVPRGVATPETKTIRALYEALQTGDGDAMAALYAPGARYSDPIFRDLRGDQVRALWKMICEGSRDLEFKVRRVAGKGGFAEAQWEAKYTFPLTGLPVHNEGSAKFAFEDGLISNHHDDWHFQKWASQALGFKGKALGWTQPFHDAVSRRALEELERYMRSK
jgi:ketosteroid isomerase-like protein